ncbi:MAG: hypothetical protein RBT59_10225 [Arcobacteraceae bacterium]|nr:hypothetical protein [Arcobacteraceae bacterium]
MNSTEKSFIIADWIFLIGITPFAYTVASLLFASMIEGFLIKHIPSLYDIMNSKQFLIFAIVIFSIGLLITFTIVIRNKVLKNRTAIPMKKTTEKFSFGVFLIYIGHLGLIAIYTLLLFAQFSPGGTVSGLFVAPAVPWMFVFYSIGYSIVNKQKLLEEFREKNELESQT